MPTTSVTISSMTAHDNTHYTGASGTASLGRPQRVNLEQPEIMHLQSQSCFAHHSTYCTAARSLLSCLWHLGFTRRLPSYHALWRMCWSAADQKASAHPFAWPGLGCLAGQTGSGSLRLCSVLPAAMAAALSFDHLNSVVGSQLPAE